MRWFWSFLIHHSSLFPVSWGACDFVFTILILSSPLIAPLPKPLSQTGPLRSHLSFLHLQAPPWALDVNWVLQLFYSFTHSQSMSRGPYSLWIPWSIISAILLTVSWGPLINVFRARGCGHPGPRLCPLSGSPFVVPLGTYLRVNSY